MFSCLFGAFRSRDTFAFGARQPGGAEESVGRRAASSGASYLLLLVLLLLVLFLLVLLLLVLLLLLLLLPDLQRALINYAMDIDTDADALLDTDAHALDPRPRDLGSHRSTSKGAGGGRYRAITPSTLNPEP